MGRLSLVFWHSVRISYIAEVALEYNILHILQHLTDLFILRRPLVAAGVAWTPSDGVGLGSRLSREIYRFAERIEVVFPDSINTAPDSGNSMARSDSFFIRATLNCDNNNLYQQTGIDLGAYVDALGKSVLRIHNIAVTFSDSTGRSLEVTSSGSAPFNGAAAQFQLLTQSQADIVLPSDRSIISTGRVIA